MRTALFARPSRSLRRGIVFCAGCCLVATASWAGHKSWRAFHLHKARQDVLAVVSLAGSFEERVDTLRAFVNDHSQHDIDGEFYAIWADPWKFDEAMAAHARGERRDRVHMECSTRSNSLARLLEALGYETRRVDVYSSDTLESHSFIDVRNPATGLWETQDPDYDIYWRDSQSHKRATMVTASSHLSTVEPCNRGGCGWHIVSGEGLAAGRLKPYFGFIAVSYTERRRRFTVYTPAADPNQIFVRNGLTGNFCTIMHDRCRTGLQPAALLMH